MARQKIYRVKVVREGRATYCEVLSNPQPDEDTPMTYEEALAEQEQQALLCPENLYRIEELSNEEGKEENV